jgi:hypothetical protein
MQKENQKSSEIGPTKKEIKRPEKPETPEFGEFEGE